MGFRPAKRVERDLAKHLEKTLASPVRCVLHGTMRAQAGAAYNVTTVRNGRAKEKELNKKERELIDADWIKHRHAPGLSFQIKGESLIDSDDRSGWEVFIKNSFSFAAYDERFEGLCESPERAFTVLDDEKNAYPGRDRVHADLLSDRTKLAFYVMPMILRADVWVEHEVRAELLKQHSARLDRYAKGNGFDRKPRFKMPSRAEWARCKELVPQHRGAA